MHNAARTSALVWTAALCLLRLPAAEPAWTSFQGGRWSALAPASTGEGFTLLPPPQTGIAFTNHLAESSAADNRILENGSGVALGDVDGDGRCDVYFCRLEGPNVLYRNLGQWRFEDITAAAGVACDGQPSTGATFADADGDGDLDLFVNGIGTGTRLLLNNGRGQFSEMTTGRLVHKLGATSMALADMDGDGDLDLYVTNYRTDTFRDDPPGLRVEAVRQPDGSIVVRPEGRFVAVTPRGGGVEVIERGERDFLYLNQGGGRFAPVNWTSGAFLDEDGNPLKEPPTDWGLAVQFRDFTGDGLPDLYVCNDFAYWPDRIWINDGGTRFRAADRLRFRHQSLSSMSVDVADVDRDGRMDLFVADMTSRRASVRAYQRPNTLEGLVSFPKGDPLFRPEVTHNTLHVARDDGSFAEIAAFAGVACSEWTWSGVFLDVDLDGWEDLLLATGNGHDVQHADVLAELARTRSAPTSENRLRNLRRFPVLETPLFAFRNRRNHTFSDDSARWHFDLPGIHTGMALADLDGDGDLDVVINRLNGPASVLRNDAAAPRVAVRLHGAGPNTQGVGARIRLLGGPVVQSQEIICGGRSLSGDDTLRVFAAGKLDAALTLEIDWRDGRRQTIPAVQAGRLYEIIEDSSAPASPKPPAPPSPAFSELPPAHRNRNESFDDFNRQRLLPWRISTRSPAVGWIDADGDGREDLLIPGGRGQADEWRHNNPNAPFQGHGPLPAPHPTPGNRAGIAVLSTGAPDGWLVAYSAVEDGNPKVPCIAAGKAWGDIAEATLGMNPGTVAAADIDGDGTLELFVGDRGVPGQWPASAASKLFGRRDGAWRSLQQFTETGMVTAALFTDLDNDGDPDLVTASELGEIRIGRNDQGRLVSTTLPGLSGLTGGWLSLAAGDFDGDGRIDLVAGNRGSNGRPEPLDPAQPALRIAWGDFNPGHVEPLVGAWDPAERRWFPLRAWKSVASALPWVPVAFPNHAAFGRASFEEILAGKPADLHEVAVRDFTSRIFLNRGDRFEPHALPDEAQWSTANALVCADFDGDGFLDLFVSQNDFGVDDESTRQDAGMGLLLRGNGAGSFQPVGPAASGLRIAGQARSAAVSDFDLDGRPDLVVGVHEGDTRVWRNTTARPALRIPIPAPAAGTRVRWILGDKAGPVTELRAGNGSGGQDSFTALLSAVPEGARIELRPPHGKARLLERSSTP